MTLGTDVYQPSKLTILKLLRSYYKYIPCNLLVSRIWKLYNHRLNMELNLQNLFGILVPFVQLYLLAEAPQPPPPAFGRYWSAKIDDISL
jgi:hypothetical protein